MIVISLLCAIVGYIGFYFLPTFLFKVLISAISVPSIIIAVISTIKSKSSKTNGLAIFSIVMNGILVLLMITMVILYYYFDLQPTFLNWN